MNTQMVGYKAKAFQPKHLAILFFITSVLPILVCTPFITGLVPRSDVSGQSLSSILIGVLTVIAIAAPVVLTALAEGKAGVQTLFGRFWKGRLSIPWFLVALLLWPTILLLINLLAQILEGRDLPIFQSMDVIKKVFIPQFFGMLFIAVTEEFVWRGYAMPCLQARWNALVSSLILGVFWALMHLPNWFMPPGNPIRTDSFLVVSGQIILTAILYTWIFNNMDGNLLGVILAHNLINVAGGLINTPGTYLRYLDWVLLAIVILVVGFYGPKELVRRTRTKTTTEKAVGQNKAPAASD